MVADARSVAAADALPLLEDALRAWRGEPLLDVRYDDFAQPEIARLEELRLALIEQRIDTELALGRDGELVPELERLVGEHPLRERFRAQLMTALYRSGRQGDALAAFQGARRVLLDELGLEPGDELRRLQRAVLEHDPELAAPPKPLAERVLQRPKLLAIAGALLLAGAVAAAAIELTRGSAAPIALRANSIAAIDPTTREVVAVIPVGERPSALVFGFGSLWVANGDDGTVMRIDPRTGHVLATLGIGGDLADLATGYGSVWVADGNQGTLTRIDPSENAVQRTISFGRADPLFPKPVFSVAVGTGGVWITRDTEIIRIDPRTNAPSERIVTPAATGIAAGGGRVWVTTANERILRFDDGVREPTASIETASGNLAPLLAYGNLWVLASGYELSEVDPGSARVYVSTPSGSLPVAEVADGDSLWVANPRGPDWRTTKPGRSSDSSRCRKSPRRPCRAAGTDRAGIHEQLSRAVIEVCRSHRPDDNEVVGDSRYSARSSRSQLPEFPHCLMARWRANLGGSRKLASFLMKAKRLPFSERVRRRASGPTSSVPACSPTASWLGPPHWNR